MMKNVWRKAGACIIITSLVAGCINGYHNSYEKKAKAAAIVETKTGSIVLDGNDIKTQNVNGLTFKGFGLLSGNSTSDLLMDYKAENPDKYAELMQYLFGGEYPIMTHVKIEMGNDQNNSTGSESSTMRTKEEKPNVTRNPGWQLAADAKKINPDVKVSILSWNNPTWVKTDEDKYTWYKSTILKAYETYGFMVDYINPNTNERWVEKSDIARTKAFRSWIDSETNKTIPDETVLKLFRNIKLIVSDEASTVSATVASNLMDDEKFYNAVDVVGYHYSPSDDINGGMKWFAEEQDKEVWNSEAQATFSDSAFRPANNVKDSTIEGTGLGGTSSALEMGNTFIKGFVQSRRTHVIYQPAIGSFYQGAQFSFKELVSARDPWSGWIHYDAGLLILEHLSKFAKTGWENDTNTAGIWRAIPQASKSTASGINPVNGRKGGENYITLAAPTKDNFSSMIINDSEYPMTYTLSIKNMKLDSSAKLEIWETRAADDGAYNENYMKCLGDITAENGVYTFSVQPYSTVTVTSLDMSKDKELTKALPTEGERTVLDTDSTGAVQSTDDEYLYADDFEYTGKTVKVLDGKGGFTNEKEDYLTSRGGDTGAMARYTHTLNGAFEVYKTEDGNRVLRQQVDKIATGVGSAWNVGDPTTLLGDFRWMNYTASVEVLFERESDQYAAVGIRQTGGSQNLNASSGYSLKVEKNGKWKLYRKDKEVETGKVPVDAKFDGTTGTWFQIKLQGAGNVIRGYVNNQLVVAYQDTKPITSGRIALGCSSYYTRFDNLAVTKVNGYAPYYTEYLDNMEMYDLTADKNTKLIYKGTWSHANGKGMYVYQRSTSTSKTIDSSLTYTFIGTGLEILGENNTGTIKVTVDKGKTRKVSLQESNNMNTTYQLSGLVYGKHTVTIALASGSITVDAVAVIGQIYNGDKITEEPMPTKDTSGLENGKSYKDGSATYVVTNISNKTVTYKKPAKTTIKNVVIPATITVTVNGKKVTLKVTGISDNAFAKCKKLSNINIQSKTISTVGKNAINGIDDKAIIKCPKGKAMAYKKLFETRTGYKKTMKII